MTLHYHGTPITPRRVLDTLAGRCFCVSYAAPGDVEYVHKIGQSVMLDNGAFSAWRVGTPTDWPGYYAWCDRWLDYRTTWAVIPDVIDGSESDQEMLYWQWPHRKRGAPVWHMNESIDRLRKLCDRDERVCIGSTAAFRVVGSEAWHRRMTEAMNAICREGRAPTWLHMLRGMAAAQWGYPFASVDSTDIGRNHNRPHQSARAMADSWDAVQCPARWERQPEQQELVA